MFSRRHVLQSTAAIGSLAALPYPALVADSTYDQFQKNLASNSWLRLYKGIEELDTGTTFCAVEGDWPSGLNGTLFRNGPGRLQWQGRRYQHWFDGDGLIQKWEIKPNGEVSHRGRLISTHKLIFDQSRNQLSLVGFGSESSDPTARQGPDGVNVGNTSVINHDDELWALWEGGSPWQIDPKTLETKGTLRLSSDSEGVPFSAHPRVEADGSLWNIGYVGAMGLLVVWHLPKGMSEPRLSVISRQPMSMPHDFMVTRNHVIVPLPPLHYEPSDAAPNTFLDAHVWHPERPLEILVMKKEDPSDFVVIEQPAQWIFHYSNAWEDNKGVIRFEAASFENPGLMFDAFSSVMRGEVPATVTPSNLVKFRVDPAKQQANSEAIFNGPLVADFPTMDTRVTGIRHHWVNTVTVSDSNSTLSKVGLFDSILRLNVDNGEHYQFSYPKGEIPEEHLFVPKPKTNDESDGWLLGTSLDYEKELTHLNVFELQKSEPQLVAKATLPRLMPLGLHGKFVS